MHLKYAFAEAILVIAAVARPLEQLRWLEQGMDPLEISLVEEDIIDVDFKQLMMKKTIFQKRQNQVLRITFDDQVHKGLINSETDALSIQMTEANTD